jgi:hypothetical protein
MSGYFRGKIDPVVNFKYGYHKYVTISDGIDCHKYDAMVVSVNKGAGNIAHNDFAKQCGH